jgi:hypothetical protein
MNRGRKVIVVVALILAVVVFAGRFMRQDQAYLHAGHVSETADHVAKVA